MKRFFQSTTGGQIRKAIPASWLLRLMAACLGVFIASSCTVVHTDATKGTSTLASLGGDMADYAGTPNGATFTRMENSTSFREINKSIRFGLGVAAAADVARSGLEAWKANTSTKAAADVTKHAATQTTKQAAIQADVTKATFVPEAPAPVAP